MDADGADDDDKSDSDPEHDGKNDGSHPQHSTWVYPSCRGTRTLRIEQTCAWLVSTHLQSEFTIGMDHLVFANKLAF